MVIFLWLIHMPFICNVCRFSSFCGSGMVSWPFLAYLGSFTGLCNAAQANWGRDFFTSGQNTQTFYSQLSTRSLCQILCGSHIKIWNLANHTKNKTKSIKMLDLLMKNWKLRVRYSLFHFFHVICKMWTAMHLPQASCTELTLYKI